MSVIKALVIMEDEEKMFKGYFDDLTMKPFELEELIMDEHMWEQAQRLKELCR